MKAIQILHYSLFGYILSLYLKYYFFKKIKTFKNTKILQGHKINYKYKSSTYFIIKSRSLTSKKMKLYLKSIQFHSKKSEVIIIGSQIDYDELYRNHYSVFGVIDITNNKSLKYIKEKIHFYLEEIYEFKKDRSD
ncbi:hypothetical protein [Streptococcus sp. OH4692_COT-348]|uniref:hypothetical protein n=1 Tax=Streptococcus sp. OH4692_COT-348 TaxID=2491052 RepID=UPI000F6001C8|nr:hypothetical protein [Streptococcus sp. OH4692_COT-348]RRD33838.1 hypothetical protein EII37_03710 [Streptococcus sp. OH4692_COT-348]